MVGNNALEARVEAECDAHSDGVRPGRGGQEAIEAVDGALNNSAIGHHHDIRDADSPGAFAPISQDVILHRLGPRPGRELSTQGLQAGSWAHGTRPHTTEGPPQGGVISPWLAHSALAGLAKQLGKGDRVAR
jgi:RNA-directed DNA polymerase